MTPPGPEAGLPTEAVPPARDVPPLEREAVPQERGPAVRPPRTPRTSVLAVITLAFGILILIPFALIFGVLALARIRKTGARGKGMAVAGLVIAGAWIVVGASLAVVAILAHRAQHASIAAPRQPAIFSLRTGQCLNSQPNGSAGQLIPCAQSHDAEVFAVFQLPGNTWPGDIAAQHQADQGCLTRLTGYVNPQIASTTLTESYVYPGRQAWAAGQRNVVCEIRDTTGKLTGSVRAAH
jgi:hypothetical protein